MFKSHPKTLDVLCRELNKSPMTPCEDIRQDPKLKTHKVLERLAAECYSKPSDDIDENAVAAIRNGYRKNEILDKPAHALKQETMYEKFWTTSTVFLPIIVPKS